MLRDKSYAPCAAEWLPVLNLGLTLWRGRFESWDAVWLRWCDREGRVIPTGAERADQERQRADQERQRAEQQRYRADKEHQRADEERQRADEERQRADEERQRADEERQRAEQQRHRAEHLAAQLRALGVTPDEQ